MKYREMFAVLLKGKNYRFSDLPRLRISQFYINVEPVECSLELPIDFSCFLEN